MVRLWEGGGVVVCVLVDGVAGDESGGWSRVVGVFGLEEGGGMLEVRGVVTPGEELRSREILMAGDWAWGGPGAVSGLSKQWVRGTLRLRGEE